MSFFSILQESDKGKAVKPILTTFFADLQLDCVFEAITADYEEYCLDEFFRVPPGSFETVRHRQEVMKELEDPVLQGVFHTFTRNMRLVRTYAGYAESLHNPDQCRKWLLDAADLYVRAILELEHALSERTHSITATGTARFSAGVGTTEDVESQGTCRTLNSAGLHAFYEWLVEYRCEMTGFAAETTAMKEEISGIRYQMELGRDRIIVSSDRSSTDYSEELNKSFAPVIELPYEDEIRFFSDLEMSLLEDSILHAVRGMNPDAFSHLESWHGRFASFLSPVLLRFEREVQFYLSVLAFLSPLQKQGFSFCFPVLSKEPTLEIHEGYDLALAMKCLEAGSNIVSNDCILSGQERLMVLTGPNQGGKTTFARALGQAAYLTMIGCPIPGRYAEMSLFDALFTHFSVEEALETQSGRLQEELLRVRDLFTHATPSSLIILNELFSTTTTADAQVMGSKILDHFRALDCFCLYVTHLHELAATDDKTISLVALIRDDASGDRTFRIVRREADGQAHAHALAIRYRLDVESLKRRLKGDAP